MDLNYDLELMMAHLEIENTTCGLKHSKEDPAENHPAVNYLCQHLGTDGEATSGIRVPICQECKEALADFNWILVYCTNCNESQWIYRLKSKLEYPEGNGIYWIDVCPYCAEVADKPWPGRKK